MARPKIRTPQVICNLSKWQLKDGQLSGQVYNIREGAEQYALIENAVRVFDIKYMVHYPKSYDEEEYFLGRLLDYDYVKCFVAERAEWPEVLKVFLTKDPS